MWNNSDSDNKQYKGPEKTMSGVVLGPAEKLVQFDCNKKGRNYGRR